MEKSGIVTPASDLIMWQIDKTIKKGDYLYAKVKNHPNSTKHGYVLYHRIVMENHLGRLLTKDEVVHHINGNKHDNRIENLEVMSRRDHGLLHKKPRKYVKLKCPECKKIFEKYHDATHLSKGYKYTTCSPRCRGKFSRNIQLHGMLPEYQKSIDENIICQFKK